MEAPSSTTETRSFTGLLAQGRVLIADGAQHDQSMGMEPGLAPEEWPSSRRPSASSSCIAPSSTRAPTSSSPARSAPPPCGWRKGPLAGQTREVNVRAAELAREAAGPGRLVAGSLGPTGQLIEPYGPLNRGRPIAAYAEQAAALAEGGADLLVLETIFALEEAVWAVEGIQSVTDLPLVVSFSFDMGTRTMMGLSPTRCRRAVVPLGIAAVGTNCGRSLADTDIVVTEILAAAGDLPVWVKPNAGVPKVVGAEVVYEAGPEMLAEHVARYVEQGARVVGGCCGSRARARRGDRAGTRTVTAVFGGARSSGVLLHVTSLPSGRLDEEAYRFVDWLVEAGQSWWQLLPLHIPDELRLSVRVEVGVRGLRRPAGPGPARSTTTTARETQGAPEGAWLEEWVRCAGEDERRAQTRFQREWLALKRYANERGIRLIGDIPLYVAGDSLRRADPSRPVRPLGGRGRGAVAQPSGGATLGDAGVRLAGARGRRLRVVALQRIERELELFDLLRIDHFRGLVEFWKLPPDEPDPRRAPGATGPGMAFFDALRASASGRPAAILEDLGYITPGVVELRVRARPAGHERRRARRRRRLAHRLGALHLHPRLGHPRAAGGSAGAGSTSRSSSAHRQAGESEQRALSCERASRSRTSSSSSRRKTCSGSAARRG